eukprot:CAMPEP_0113939112 /NCGR_PEP_ID=MMETSP1339-20121228/5496_1 /TAXON_ID=94617 /ORGANISM="Fibrocapsa japonica" /LENGTH=59 /DNA_ID=CAMNT_0000942531 /DNA_START=116 /DNA_END=291 /DNA_ORIENTATION=- /assembly_acc=CAM_ASM_000762
MAINKEKIAMISLVGAMVMAIGATLVFNPVKNAKSTENTQSAAPGSMWKNIPKKKERVG